MGFGGERVFLFSWKNNSFFEDDPQRNEKIALCCVGSTTASFEVGTAQCYFVLYKPRKKIALLYIYIFILAGLEHSPFHLLGASGLSRQNGWPLAAMQMSVWVIKHVMLNVTSLWWEEMGKREG